MIIAGNSLKQLKKRLINILKEAIEMVCWQKPRAEKDSAGVPASSPATPGAVWKAGRQGPRTQNQESSFSWNWALRGLLGECLKPAKNYYTRSVVERGRMDTHTYTLPTALVTATRSQAMLHPLGRSSISWSHSGVLSLQTLGSCAVLASLFFLPCFYLKVNCPAHLIK